MKPLTPSPGSPVKIFLAMAFVVACWGYSPTGIHIGLQAYDPGHLALCEGVIDMALKETGGKKGEE
jgi:hypothetical protein